MKADMYPLQSSAGHRRLFSVFVISCFLFFQQSLAQEVTRAPDIKGFLPHTAGGFQAIRCQTSSTFSRSGAFGACGPTTEGDFDFVTTCLPGGTAKYKFGGTMVCTGQFPNCYTITLFDTAPVESATQSWLEIGCGNSVVLTMKSLYWQTTASTTTTSAPSTFTTTTSGTLSGPVETGTSSAPPSSATTDPAAQPTKSSSSKAWIAGAVIGPLFGIALVAFGIWMWRRRRATKQWAGNDTAPAPQPYLAVAKQQYQQEVIPTNTNNLDWVKLHNGSPPPVSGYAGWEPDNRYSGVPRQVAPTELPANPNHSMLG
ncbi:hypothetical protein QBC38DRAFT_549243 [Podospora fimiseda]|uniref:Transmembrane protein n=1 Tax=Podospora fimiseda TaxID=252190 RepID=A0AAN7BFT5_9PEZI|nr:hypothetical protein QBC38DRAFT_549243 [Podospora fimiseda]